ncbi:leucine--tRNA ligase [Candidatus Woesearchaeota archaeon]|nr:leucine--tRNA ligase [Candidatus Woesearchaeota archaeon]
MADKLDFVKIQEKWKRKYKENKIGEVDLDKNKKKWFMIWAYTTASGFIHMGHMRGYSYADVICRYKRMNGHNVLLPAGGHATGNGAITKAYRLQQKDPKLIAEFKENGVPEKDLKRLEDPDEFVNFFCKQYIDNFRTFGFIGDWERRFVSTISPEYQKFITWQFMKLKELGLLTQKPYFATACVKCGPVAVDPSEMDLQKGGNAEQQEFTLIKLRYEEDDQFIMCATLRPETMYGQTNIWIDPDTTYAKIKVPVEIKKKKKTETWIVSKECAEKLKFQIDGIKDAGEIHAKEMLGNYCHAPAVDREIIILPSSFCDPNIGSGIVTSVPSDAPHDYMGLEDLKTTKSLWEKYGLNHGDLMKIELIPIIKTPGYGDFPAKEICERLGIKSQHDHAKLEQAKKEIYKLGFHTGVMNENCGPYAGMKVTEAKDKMKQDLIENGDADIMYDLSEEVICRCGEHVIIKRYDDQWFIRYSDKKLTETSKKHAKTMNIFPDSYRDNMQATLDWFEDRACARQGKWMGTVFPFDEKYIIEAISDSTLYPIYYLVSLYVNEGKLKEENLTEEFFDFVYLGKGKIEDVSKKCKTDKELLKKIQADVQYWYPLDINLGGKEHQRVHFPPFVMNHVAILPKDFWPRGIFVNYWIVGKEGGKLSKSKGGTLPIPGVAQEFGVDNMRLYYTNSGSPFADVEFEDSSVRNYSARLEKTWALFSDFLEYDSAKASEENKTMDKWIESKFNSRLKNITEKMEEFDFKLSTDEIYFNMYKDLMLYKNRGGNNKKIISSILNKWTRIMGVFTPFIAEEMWEKLGNKDLAAEQEWPKVEKAKIDKAIEAAEEMFMQTRDDINHVLKLAKIEKPKEIKLYIAPNWKYELVTKLEPIIEKTKNQGQIIQEIMKDAELKKHGKDVAAIVQRIIKSGKVPVKAEQKTELDLLNDAKSNLETEFKCKVTIIKAEESKEPKAQQAMPGKPAILAA